MTGGSSDVTASSEIANRPLARPGIEAHADAEKTSSPDDGLVTVRVERRSRRTPVCLLIVGGVDDATLALDAELQSVSWERRGTELRMQRTHPVVVLVASTWRLYPMPFLAFILNVSIPAQGARPFRMRFSVLRRITRRLLMRGPNNCNWLDNNCICVRACDCSIVGQLRGRSEQIGMVYDVLRTKYRALRKSWTLSL